MLNTQIKKHNDQITGGKLDKHKDYIQTGGGNKRKNVGARRIGNNSNKIYDYRDLIKDDE